MENEFVFYDRDVLAMSSVGTHLPPPPPQPQKVAEPPPTTVKGSRIGGESGGCVAQKISSSSLYSCGTQGSSSLSAGGATRGNSPTPELVSLGATVENLLGTLEEAKMTYVQLKELAVQLARLDEALKVSPIASKWCHFMAKWCDLLPNVMCSLM